MYDVGAAVYDVGAVVYDVGAAVYDVGTAVYDVGAAVYDVGAAEYDVGAAVYWGTTTATAIGHPCVYESFAMLRKLWPTRVGLSTRTVRPRVC